MPTFALRFTNRCLYWLESKALRAPWLLLALVTALCTVSVYYTVNNLGVNTNTADMLSPELPFQKNRKRLEKTFPKDAETLLLVVEATTPEKTAQAAENLVSQLQYSPLFISVYSPASSQFFKKQSMLYLDDEDLDKLAGELTDAQPFIGHLGQNYSLEGLFSIISYSLKNQNDKLPMDINPLLTEIANTIEAQLNQQNKPVSWQRLILGEDSELEKNRRLVIARPKLDFNELMPAEKGFLLAQKIARGIESQNPNVSIRITGEKALEHEELESVSRGAAIAGIVSLILVCLSMLIAFRSFKLLLATFIALITGLVLTAGFATLAIGHLNLISIAFAVLYIGLGVDYAIHLCLRYRELRLHHHSNLDAIHHSIQSVGSSLFLCALTTSIGFFAFIPTDYSGVSELGIISGVGMFIGLAVSLTILPALLKIMPVEPKPNTAKNHHFASLCDIPFRFSGTIRFLSVVLAIAGASVVTQLKFDSNPVNLRDPKSESVSTFNDLLLSPEDSPFAVEALSADLDKAKALARRFEKLDSVDQAVTLADFVPENQEEKLEIVEDLALLLGGELDSYSKPIDHSKTREALFEFAADIDRAIRENAVPASTDTLKLLQRHVMGFLAISSTSADPEAMYVQLGKNILGLLPYSIHHLKTSLGATPFGIDDIPREISEHWLSDSGIYRIQVLPKKNLNDQNALEEFVEQVIQVDDSVSGLAIADSESGKAVINAFIEAFSGALLAILVLLVAMLGSMKKTLLVIGPLLLAAVLTGAANVLLNNPFNFANIIALPLLMGMGVDSGIHIVHRLSSASDEINLLQTSTARGVLFSSVTTFCSFTSLAFSPHVGTASMGLLLAIGITLNLFCTLVVLPAFSGKQL
ncbi:MAG: MMPL family transporter [Gammaproteobacteria bacterium]